MAQFINIFHNEQLTDDRKGPPHSISDIQRFIPVRSANNKQSDLLNNVFWADITNLTNEEEVANLSEIIRLNPVTQEDLTVRTREKIESFGNYKFYTLNEFLDLDHESIQLKIVKTPDLVLTVHRSPKDLVCVAQVINRFENHQLDIKSDADWLVYALVDEVCNVYVEAVRNIIADIQTLDNLILGWSLNDENSIKTVDVLHENTSVNQINLQSLPAGSVPPSSQYNQMIIHTNQTTLLSRMVKLRRNVVSIRSSLWAKQEIVQEMMKDAREKKDEQLEAYLRDVNDHVIRMLNKITVSSDLLNHHGHDYLTRVLIEMGKNSEEMNSSMQRFNAVATIFLPLSVLTGLWGMNVRVPGQLRTDDPDYDPHFSAFWGIAGCLCLVAILISCFFHCRKWI